VERTLEIAVGLILALAIGLGATCIGFDRDRAFYPTVLVVVASYYALFATQAGDMHALGLECLVIVVFAGAAVAGFKSTLWLVVAGLAAHGIFDLAHGGVIANPGVPAWWPHFCLAYDLAAAAYLAIRLIRWGRRA
jgi:hypothetical protein